MFKNMFLNWPQDLRPWRIRVGEQKKCVNLSVCLAPVSIHLFNILFITSSVNTYILHNLASILPICLKLCMLPEKNLHVIVLYFFVRYMQSYSSQRVVNRNKYKNSHLKLLCCTLVSYYLNLCVNQMDYQ